MKMPKTVATGTVQSLATTSLGNKVEALLDRRRSDMCARITTNSVHCHVITSRPQCTITCSDPCHVGPPLALEKLIRIAIL